MISTAMKQCFYEFCVFLLHSHEDVTDKEKNGKETQLWASKGKEEEDW